MFKVEIIGNLGADVEIKEHQGKKFASFRVAHSEKFTDAAGNQTEQTDWFNVTLNDVDSKVIQYLKQGVKVFVRGNARLRCYSSPKLRMMVAGCDIFAREIELCGGSSDDVPRQLVIPETSELTSVSKYYWCDYKTTGMKKEDVRQLIDARGNQYMMDYHGFVTPVAPEVEESETNQSE